MRRISPRYLPVFLILMLVAFSACEDAAEPELEAEAPAEPAAPAEVTPTTERAKINLNTATEEEFLTIPGVGDRMVGEFEEYRPYVSIQQFRQEIGKYVDEEQVAAYEQYVYVPVDPNESDAETLRQLPGIDASEAAELIAGRPYASREAFLERLSTYASGEERALAETYLTAE